MLRHISSLKLQGANFETLTELPLFNKKTNSSKAKVHNKGALLFGRNGTGKSTMAKSFRKIAGEVVPEIQQAILLDYAGNEFILTDDEKKHIFVFDEDYIDKNVKLQEDHLNTIVLLGEAVDLTDKITEAQKYVTKVQDEYERQQKIYADYNDPNNVPKNIRKKCIPS